jgi:hypothetical protein
MMAEVEVGIAKAVPGMGLSAMIAKLLLQAKASLTMGKGLLVVSEPGIVPSDSVKGLALCGS